jgi:hypothetical protein
MNWDSSNWNKFIFRWVEEEFWRIENAHVKSEQTFWKSETLISRSFKVSKIQKIQNENSYSEAKR